MATGANYLTRYWNLLLHVIKSYTIAHLGLSPRWFIPQVIFQIVFRPTVPALAQQRWLNPRTLAAQKLVVLCYSWNFTITKISPWIAPGNETSHNKLCFSYYFTVSHKSSFDVNSLEDFLVGIEQDFLVAPGRTCRQWRMYIWRSKFNKILSGGRFVIFIIKFAIVLVVKIMVVRGIAEFFTRCNQRINSCALVAYATCMLGTYQILYDKWKKEEGGRR